MGTALLKNSLVPVLPILFALNIGQEILGSYRTLLLRACIYYPNIKTLKEKHISSVITNIGNKSHENLVTIEIPTNAPQRIKDIKKLYAQTALKMTNNRKNKAGELLKISSQVLDNWLGNT